MRRAVVLAGVIVAAYLGMGAWFFGGATGAVYLIDEDCEGSGEPAGWDGTGNWDYSTSPLVGSQSYAHTSASDQATFAVSDSDTFTMIFAFRIADATPASAVTLAGIRNSSLGSVCLARLATDGGLSVYTNGSDSAVTSDKLSDGTMVYIKMVWNDGSTCSVEWNTSRSFSGSGNKFTSKTGGTTADATVCAIGTLTSALTFYYDEIQLSTSDIP